MMMKKRTTKKCRLCIDKNTDWEGRQNCGNYNGGRWVDYDEVKTGGGRRWRKNVHCKENVVVANSVGKPKKWNEKKWTKRERVCVSVGFGIKETYEMPEEKKKRKWRWNQTILRKERRKGGNLFRGFLKDKIERKKRREILIRWKIDKRNNKWVKSKIEDEKWKKKDFWIE